MSEKVIVIRGKVHWAKVTGAARPYTGNPKYDKGPYWSIDITPDAKSREKIEAAGIADKLRTPKGEKETRKETYLSLKQLETKKDGGKNKSPKISDIKGQEWDGSDIGNESICDIKVKVKDYGTTVGAYLQEIRVLQHVEYNGAGGFEPLSEDDEFFAASGKAEPDTKGEAGNPDDLDDDIPF
jgi:hypothetical protein